MPERKQKKEVTSLRTPQPKKLGLSVPPLLRLPHDELIRPQQPQSESPEAHKSGHFSSSLDAHEEALEMNQVSSTSHADDARDANLASLADSARLARTDTLGLQNASLANPARHASIKQPGKSRKKCTSAGTRFLSGERARVAALRVNSPWSVASDRILV